MNAVVGRLRATDFVADLGAELVRIKVVVIVTDGTALALAAKQAANTIPIVMVYVAAPVGSRLVTSLARPGGKRHRVVRGPTHGGARKPSRGGRRVCRGGPRRPGRNPGQGLDMPGGLAIEGTRVAAMRPNLRGRIVLDAAGRVVAPGFVDLHSHAQWLACPHARGPAASTPSVPSSVP